MDSAYASCCMETLKHIEQVRSMVTKLAVMMIERGAQHDASKLQSPEVEYFVEHTPKLSKLTYGSPEYAASLAALKPALDHHYANNRHHTDHFPNGVRGMNLVDIVEMLCDWKSSAGRHIDGNILKSIEINAKRFDLSDDLVCVLKNTAELLEL